MGSGTCLMPECGKAAVGNRGICRRCAKQAEDAIAEGVCTWRELEAAGYAEPNLSPVERALELIRTAREAVPRKSRGGRKPGPRKPCSETGCTRDAVARGLCATHYASARKRGFADADAKHPAEVAPPPPAPAPAERETKVRHLVQKGR